MASLPYKKPYIDSDVFIGVIKNEEIPETQDGGTVVIVLRGEIGAHILTLAEEHVFPVYISPLTIAEVHKIKLEERVEGDEDSNVLEFFENDFVTVIPIDREDGEEANKLCRIYQDKRLSPTDALHLACAKKAECDIVLTWDKDFLSIGECDGIHIERPQMWNPPVAPIQHDLFTHSEESSEEAGESNQETTEEAESVTVTADVSGGGNEQTEVQTATAPEEVSADEPLQVETASKEADEPPLEISKNNRPETS